MQGPHCAVAVLVLLVACCPAQTVQLAPNIAVAEAEYREAVAAWIQADPELPRDLLRLPADQMHGRVRRVAALRDTAMVKKERYLSGILERLRTAREQLTGDSVSRIPTAALRNDLPRERARIELQLARTEDLLRALPPGAESEALHRDLEKERAHLLALRTSIGERGTALDALDRAQDEVSAAPAEAGLIARLLELARICEEERQASERQRLSWRELYAAMDRAIDANARPADRSEPEKARGKRGRTPKVPANLKTTPGSS